MVDRENEPNRPVFTFIDPHFNLVRHFDGIVTDTPNTPLWYFYHGFLLISNT